MTNHVVQLSGLLENTVYHFRVKSRGQNGLQSTSADATFTTANPSGTVQRSLSFNGSSSYVRVADRPSLRIASNLTAELGSTGKQGRRYEGTGVRIWAINDCS